MKIEIIIPATAIFEDGCLWYCHQQNEYHHQFMMSDAELFGYHKLTRNHFGICWVQKFYDLHKGEMT